MKLSWLMDAVLAVNGSLFPKKVGIIAKNHAFEAALFMIGYDIRRVITLMRVAIVENFDFKNIAKIWPAFKYDIENT